MVHRARVLGDGGGGLPGELEVCDQEAARPQALRTVPQTMACNQERGTSMR